MATLHMKESHHLWHREIARAACGRSVLKTTCTEYWSQVNCRDCLKKKPKSLRKNPPPGVPPTTK